MGNNLGVVIDNYIGGAQFPCHLQLGPSASIDLSRNFEETEEGILFGMWDTETWSVTYTVDEKRCEVQLVRYYDQHGNEELLNLYLRDCLSGIPLAVIDMKITKANYLRILDNILWKKRNTSFDAGGVVMDTKVKLYGSEGRWGLIAAESKRNKTEEDAEVVTLAHYVLKSSGTRFHKSTETDIGLSVVAKFRASNGKFQITEEGLEQHPVSALLYMFHEVNRTGIWKPAMCPHCDHKRRGKLFWQSDSEDSDSVSMPLPRATPRNARGASNGGRFRGR